MHYNKFGLKPYTSFCLILAYLVMGNFGMPWIVYLRFKMVCSCLNFLFIPNSSVALNLETRPLPVCKNDSMSYFLWYFVVSVLIGFSGFVLLTALQLQFFNPLLLDTMFAFCTTVDFYEIITSLIRLDSKPCEHVLH